MVPIWMRVFLTVIWFILPFVIFSIKARIEETLQRVELLDQRIDSIERKISMYTAAYDQQFQFKEHETEL